MHILPFGLLLSYPTSGTGHPAVTGKWNNSGGLWPASKGMAKGLVKSARIVAVEESVPSCPQRNGRSDLGLPDIGLASAPSRTTRSQLSSFRELGAFFAIRRGRVLHTPGVCFDIGFGRFVTCLRSPSHQESRHEKDLSTKGAPQEAETRVSPSNADSSRARHTEGSTAERPEASRRLRCNPFAGKRVSVESCLKEDASAKAGSSWSSLQDSQDPLASGLSSRDEAEMQ